MEGGHYVSFSDFISRVQDLFFCYYCGNDTVIHCVSVSVCMVQ